MKNFAAQPDGGGNIEILTGLDLKSNVAGDGFVKHPNFIDNCKDCGMKNFANADGLFKGDFWSGINIGDIFKTGAGYLGDKSAKEQAELAIEIERNRAEAERAKAEAERAKAEAELAKSESTAAKFKGYVLPLAVTGVVLVGTIAAYFYFKKKKIS